MKNFLKNPLKVIVAVAFIVAAGLGVSTSLSTSNKQNDINLSILASEAKAWGEDEDGGWFSIQHQYHCPKCSCIAMYCEHTIIPNFCLPVDNCS